MITMIPPPEQPMRNQIEKAAWAMDRKCPRKNRYDAVIMAQTFPARSHVFGFLTRKFVTGAAR